ncbi:MAG: DUF2891 domain-containing protein [Pseudomonadota bacterium]|jgi:hypothetical protein
MVHRLLLAALLLAPVLSAAEAAQPAPNTDGYAQLALQCIHQQYPNHLSLGVGSDTDLVPPTTLHPSFYGCLDWHSAVHGHWLLVRLLRLHPSAPWAKQARAQLEEDFSNAHIAAEVAYFEQPNRTSFERPYGLAWLLTLTAELRQWDDPDAQRWLVALLPLETVAANRIQTWLPKLHYPIRIGEHNQTAFSFGLIWDWATVAHRADLLALLTDAAHRFYAHDRACPLQYEPSGEDFLSPCLGEADFMRRVLPPPAFATWLAAFMPELGRGAALAPAVVTDRSDPKLAHLDGLNLSRAWMLRGIASALPRQNNRRAALEAMAAAHAQAALPAVTGEHYEGGHWLGTFAVYLQSQEGAHPPHP